MAEASPVTAGERRAMGNTGWGRAVGGGIGIWKEEGNWQRRRRS
jgi:hypothetical protein